jgi:hypothetical protein
MQLISFGNPREQLPPEGGYEEGAYYPRDPKQVGCAYRVSTAFEVVDGRRMPLILELESLFGMENLREPMWFASVELRDGAPKIANFGFKSQPGQRELKWSDFQRAREAVYVFYAAFCADLGPDGEPIYRTDQDAEKQIAEFIEQRRTGRRRLKTEDYKYAAQVYRDNFDETPTQAVADAFEVGLRRAGDIVAECRRRGFLPPTKQGKKKI